jgi:NB-ARC domain
MDAITFIVDSLSEPLLKDFLSQNGDSKSDNLDFALKGLVKSQRYMKGSNFKGQPEIKKQALINGLRLTTRKLGKFMREISLSSQDHVSSLILEWEEVLDFVNGIVFCCYTLQGEQTEHELELEEQVGVNSRNLEIVRSMLGGSTDGRIPSGEQILNAPTLNKLESLRLFVMKAFPALGEHSGTSKEKTFLSEISKELDNLPQQISMACHGIPLALILIGSLLSLKEMIYDVWNQVKEDLCRFNDADNQLLNIVTYCYEDLPFFLKPCFLYLACYPMNYKISATSLINIWIAEGFISTVGKKTVEETAYEYLEQLVQR